jgi:hypothetical protein
MFRRWTLGSVFLFSLFFQACHPSESTSEEVLFTKLPSDRTGITFSNQLFESEDFNIIQYLYYYNGGGVAAGDINGDGLPDLFFSANQLPNQLYLNKGNFEFENISKQAGILQDSSWSTGISMADVNADGLLDIYVCQVGDYKNLKAHHLLYINNGDLTFTESAAEYGLDFRGFGQQAAFFDYDGDGDLDVYLLNHSVHDAENYGPSEIRLRRDSLAGDRLLRNEGGRFVDVSAEAGIYGAKIGFGLGMSVSDVDGNGCPDLYICNDFHENDYLYLNQCDGTFREVIRQAIGHTSTFSMGVDIADINNDLRPDILSLDMKPYDESVRRRSEGADPYNIYEFKLRFGYHYQYPRNMLQLNRGVDPEGQLHFSEVGQMAGLDATDWSWSALLADLDNDGWKDLFVTNGIFRRPNDLDYKSYASSRVIQQQATDMELAAVMPSGEVPNKAFRNQNGWDWQETSNNWGLSQSGISNGAVYADLDLDGDLDLVVSNLMEPAGVYRNQSKQNYLQLRLTGSEANPFAYGAKAIVYSGDQRMSNELQVTRGWQSSVEPILHFGLGDAVQVDSLRMIWPDGRQQLIRQVKTNQRLEIQYQQTATRASDRVSPDKPLMQAVADGNGIRFTHYPNNFRELDIEKLIPHRMADIGPSLATADVNGDGRTDVYLGGEQNQPGTLWIQNKEGRFELQAESGLEDGTLYSDADAAFFDADGDGDPDLYCVSGSYQRLEPNPFLTDRLYLNDGQGHFKRSQGLPNMAMNGSCVVPLDFNKDGAMDLFVGARARPGQYGVMPRSELLQNDGKGTFIRIMDDWAEPLNYLGMVTDATWDAASASLWVVGEWMPVYEIRFSSKGLKVDEQAPSGWWNSVGLQDTGERTRFWAGNAGWNTFFKQVDEDHPLRYYIRDFDQNGTLDPVLTYHPGQEEIPFASKDELVMQMPGLKKKFVKYEGFAQTPLEGVFGKEALSQSTRLAATQLGHVRQTEKGYEPLPKESQLSSVHAIAFADVNRDGREDVLLGGNTHGYQPSIGRNDASLVQLLLQTPEGEWEVAEPSVSGLFVRGEVRGLEVIESADGGSLLLIARYGEELLVYRW